MTQSRSEKLLTGIDPVQQSGLEIGALCRPIVAPHTGPIRYVDHCTTAELREKYAEDPTVDCDAIVDVSYVWGGQSLRELVGDERFDYIIASHVIEHVPDLIGWLKELASVLKPGGILALAIPDKRWCFDCRRENSGIADLLEAYLEKRKRPNLRQVADLYFGVAHVREADLWAGSVGLADIQSIHGIDHVDEDMVRDYDQRIRDGEYIDVHCNVFTPYSFIEILGQLGKTGFLDYRVVSFHETAERDIEFFVSLERLPAELSAKQTKSAILDSLPEVTAPLLPGQWLAREREHAQVLSEQQLDMQQQIQALEAENQRLQYEKDQLLEVLAARAERERLLVELARTEQQLQYSQAATCRLHEENQNLRSSSSWRLTAPLRGVRRLLGR